MGGLPYAPIPVHWHTEGNWEFSGRSALPVGRCLLHGYHGRVSCPSCNTGVVSSHAEPSPPRPAPVERSATDIFTNRPPTAEQADVLDQITEAMISCAEEMQRLLPPSAERTLAVRKLEEASMWAKKACVFTVTS